MQHSEISLYSVVDNCAASLFGSFMEFKNFTRIYDCKSPKNLTFALSINMNLVRIFAPKIKIKSTQSVDVKVKEWSLIFSLIF
jgi:hypothetical protein